MKANKASLPRKGWGRLYSLYVLQLFLQLIDSHSQPDDAIPVKNHEHEHHKIEDQT